MEPNFTPIEILRARAAQYGLTTDRKMSGEWIVQIMGTARHDEGHIWALQTSYPEEEDALNAAIRLGEIARRQNEGSRT